MSRENDLNKMRDTMVAFAQRSGLSPSAKPPRRYLWTDAFAVCNFLELNRQTGAEEYRRLALQLIDQVHVTLGRHRDDDPRSGWISGLDERQGALHPTAGGLRIGKQMSERRPGEPLNDRLEWDRDGQYYHYLTRWMHALNQVSEAVGDPVYNRWAIELAKTAHAAFTNAPVTGGPKRMYWKMSVDLTYPLVDSMGQHDPLDGLITYSQLQATAAARGSATGAPDLNREIEELAEICKDKSWVTQDSLGIGGLLVDAFKLSRLISRKRFEKTGMLEVLLESTLPGLHYFQRENPLRLPAEYRLAFRELGLTIGLQAADMMHKVLSTQPAGFANPQRLFSRLKEVLSHGLQASAIREFWMAPVNQESASWMEHLDINSVMLATTMAPDGYVSI